MWQKVPLFFKQITFLILGIIIVFSLVPQNAEATCVTGGLVPCGRQCDDIATPLITESEPCNLCAIFYMLKQTINFITSLSVILGTFILILAGLLYAISAGNPGKIELAKTAATSVIIGMAIITVAWLGIAFILQGMGYATFSTWNQVNCTLPVI